ncbi:hypothetical protein NDU88_008576, partial [Pleurodeles waltl]
RLRHKHYSQIALASAPTKHCGVVLLFNRSVHFKETGSKKDKEGWFLMLKGSLDGKLCTIATVYAPNSGQTQFLLQFLNELEGFAEGEVVLMGDFNLVWDSTLDTTHPQRSQTSAFAKSVKSSF